ncbi:DNA cross-link repair 1A protein [Bufo bufo]|uniref:DNA cross-link repair 1A protein n=1 Tax=Bufo bufo TaxID=8384 RepID=UPI001ABDB829|nr:DNA cross-link repair 1A protein [Bufo bufo]
MSDNEDEIWGYKSIRKRRDRNAEEAGCQEQARKSRDSKKRSAQRKTNQVRAPTAPQLSTPKRNQAETANTPSPVTPQNRNSGHCPSCQMPFSILLVQTPRWHVSECLDAPPTAQTECPDGARCRSTLPSHYKRFSHFLLAQSRALDLPPLSPPRTPDPALLIFSGLSPAKSNTSTSKKNTKLKSPKSQSPASSQESVRRTPLEVWLSSPSKASQDSLSQETSIQVTAAKSPPLPQQDEDKCDRTISFSPLVSGEELFSEEEGDLTIPGRSPHPRRSPPHKNEAVETPSPCNISSGGTCEWTRPGGEELLLGADYWSGCGTAASDIHDHGPNNRLLLPHIKTEGDAASSLHVLLPHLQHPVKAERPAAHLQEGLSQASQAMTSSAKAMKQMDIGVFFGLKPKALTKKTEEQVPLKTQTSIAVSSQNVRPAQKRKATGSLGDYGGVVENVSGVPVPAASGTQRRGGKRFRQNTTTEEGGRGKKQCPFYKKIPGTGFTVDAFQYGEIEGCSAYFLTHFHSDHYGGLTKKFRFPIYCSKITGNLVQSKLRVEKEFITCLPMYMECTVDGVKVVLLDANHCPGAVLLLFILPNGTSILHTGDFRAEPSMERYPALLGRKIHTLYLDTTYCSPEYTFPPQQEAVQFAVNAAFEMMTLHPRTLVVCGTYSVGKERVFLAIADVLGCKVCMSQDKYKTMQCLESDEIRALVTTDWHSTALHVLPMMQVNFKGLNAHLNKFSGRYDRILAFKPTGWTYSAGCGSVADIRPDIRGKVTLYGIPYSEHSSFSEMKRFVQFIKPQKIIPTVNMGNWKSRTTMEKYFAEWLSGSR